MAPRRTFQRDAGAVHRPSSNYHRVIGIDLGTTYCAVAAYNIYALQTEPLPGRIDGVEVTTPSVISHDPVSRKVIVGWAAKNNLPYAPQNTIVEIKREMGEEFRSETLTKYKASGVFSVGNPVRVCFDGRWLTPQEISAFILMRIKQVAEEAIGEEIRDAVLTVPAYFGHKQKRAILEAALLAGLYPRQLIPEPIAAAICYGVDRGEPERRRYLVYDLGGGTFDVSVIQVEGAQIEFIATSGDPRLGGSDFDDAITTWAVDQLRRPPYGLDLRDDARAHAIIKLKAERAKTVLSFHQETLLELPELKLRDLPSLVLTRATMLELIEPRLTRSLARVDEALDKAALMGVMRDDLDAVLLVGGSSRIPRVRTLLVDHFGRGDSFVPVDADPAAVVARGAALLAHRFVPSPPPFDIKRPVDSTLVDVVAHHSNTGGKYSAGSEHETGVEGIDALAMTRDKVLKLYEGTPFEEPAAVAPLPHVVVAPSIHPEENVQFTVYRPRAIVPEEWYPLLAFAHLSERRPEEKSAPDPVEEVKRQAEAILVEDRGEFLPLTLDSRKGVPRRGEITFVPVVEGLEFNPPHRTFQWVEPVHREEFRLRAAAAMNGQTARGQLSVFLGAILLADVSIAIKVDVALRVSHERPETEATQVRPYRKIFASYSHKDVAVVEQFERYVHSLGDEYVRDSRVLRAGEEWNEQLADLITQADIFQLFWSWNSMESRFVRQEWEHALSLHRKNFVRPTYWEEPLPETAGMPPPALRRLHFQKLPIERSSAGGITPTGGGLSGYWAFISCSNKDISWARWLHEAIETYDIPAGLAAHSTPAGERAPKHLRPIFCAGVDLPTSSDLGAKIKEALRASRYLIVICSPNAARSEWVNDEVEAFLRMGRSDRVLAVIVDGEPNAGDERECFPAALRRAEPIVVDARRKGDGKDNAKLKLLASMLGVGLDRLKERETHRRIRRLQLAIAPALILIVGLAGLYLQAERGREKAVKARQQAESILQYSLLDMRDKLEPVGRLDIVQDVQNRVDAYYRELGIETGDPNADRNRAVGFANKGDRLLAQGDLASALREYRAGLQVSERLASSDPSNAVWQREVSLGHEKMGDVLQAQGDLAGAQREYQASLQIRERLASLDPSKVDWQRDVFVGSVKMAVNSEMMRQGDAMVWWRKAYEQLSSMKQRGIILPSDEEDLERLKQKVGG
jgi:actin-like ATPase involved in cell morphogenesis/tetratricopeptide (TPR) repeat protein